jgi:hypothetical protein
MTLKAEWVAFHGTFATTHSIDAYGGVKFPRSVLERLAQTINRDGFPMSQHHDASQRVRTRDIRAEVVLREDGEYGLIGSGEIHRDDAHVINDLGFLSITLVAPLKGRSLASDKEHLVIAGNAAWYPDSALAAAESELSRTVPSEAVRLYEFAFHPNPNIVVTVSRAAFALLGGEVLWDGIKLLWSARRSLAGRDAVPTLITIHVEDGDRTAIGKVETLDRATVKQAMKSLDRAIDKVLDSPHDAPTTMWNEVEGRWDDVSG